MNPHRVSLSNGVVEFEFDDQTGSLCQIRDIAAQREFLQDSRGNRLFKLVAPTAEYFSRPLYSHEATRPTLTKNGDTLRIVYPQLLDGGRPSGISAAVAVRLPAGSAEALFAITVKNDGPADVHEVHFPWMGGWTGGSGKGKDLISVGFHSKFDPHAALPDSSHPHTYGQHHQRMFLPAPYMLPFMDISCGGYGLSFCNTASVPRTGGAYFENLAPDYQRLCLSWAWVFQPFMKPGQTWTSPDVAVGPYEGDWHQTVDRMRAHIRPWWTPPKTPQRLKQAIGMFSVQIGRGQNGESYYPYEDIPAIARDCLKYGVRDLQLWDLYAQLYLRPDSGGFWDDMPPERMEVLRRELEEARRMGCHTCTVVNFRLITERARLYQQLASEVQLSMFGRSMIESWACSIHHAQYLQNPIIEAGGHPLCQSSSKFREFALKLFQQTLDLGFSSIHIDQAGYEFRPCFAAGHGHECASDTVERNYLWVKEARRLLQARNPESYLVGEVPNLYSTQFMDVGWSWGLRNERAEILRYLLPESLLFWSIDENERNVIAKAFAMGCLLSLMTQQKGHMAGLLSDEPALAVQVARLAALKQQTADFMTDARFLDNRGLTVEGGDAYAFDARPGIMVTLANDKPEPCSLKVTVNPEALGKRIAGEGRLHIEGKTVQSRSRPAGGGPATLEVRLPPYGAGVWCLPGQKG